MIRYLPEAKDEFIEAARFYECREPGLGDRFLDELEACLGRISRQPALGGAVTSNLRQRLLKKFPFSVIYAYEDEVLLVVAVAHMTRKPGYWKARKRD